MKWAVLTLAIALEVAATLSLRASDGFGKKIWVAPVAVGYLGSFWLTLSLGMPVDIAYGIWTACGVALVAVFAKFPFTNRLSRAMVCGLTLIVARVLVIEMSGAVQ